MCGCDFARVPSADDPNCMIDWHTVLWGDEQCRQTGAWDRNTCQSKERALSFARVYLQQGKIVFAIERDGQIVMDEVAILEHFKIPRSK
jgi:hypothetical protein